MTTHQLPRDRMRALFDLRKRGGFSGNYEGDPYPAFHELRERGPVVEGVPHELIGFEGPAGFHGIPDPSPHHFSVFSYEAVDAVYRNEELFRSAPVGTEFEGNTIASSMLYMNGSPHRRYRTLVQPSFVPAKAQWWTTQWIDETVTALIDGFQADKKAELNIDFDAAIPTLTITGSFGVSPDRALDIRGRFDGEGPSLEDIVMPIIRERRERPTDDLISVLCQAEITDEDGEKHRLSDDEIMAFSALLLIAGSGTTWKQLGITLTALLTTPDALDAVREDRAFVKNAVEESLRWNATDPVFSRWAADDTELAGVEIPKGAVLHLVLGAQQVAAPERWEHPDDYDIFRPLQPHLGFASGPHICLGMHVARAEMVTGINALLDRLPNLRLDPDHEVPRIIGMYERGPNEVNVVWD